MAQNKNKKTANRKKQDFASRYAFWIVIGVLLVATAVIVILKFNEKPKTSDPESSDQQTETTSTNSEVMDNSDITSAVATQEETTAEDDDTTTDKTPAQYEGTNPNTLTKLTGNITYNGISNGKTYVVRVNIDQNIGETGSCVLTMTSTSKHQYIKSVHTMESPSTATCNGFDIDIGQLKSGETYDVSIVVSAEDKTMTLQDKITIPESE